MSIPKYDEMYRAFLNCLADGQAHKSKEVKDLVASVFSISEKERAEMLPSGKQQLFDNRIGWTRTYLKKAGLIQSPSRGVYIITPTGQQVLAENPPQIDNVYLQRFESFRQFISPNPDESATPSHETVVSSKTPQDILDEAFQQINATLAEDLLAEVMKQPPSFFEHLVVKLLTQMGYGGSVENAGAVIGQTGDEGIDGIIREDKLGFSLIFIQAKRWDCDIIKKQEEKIAVLSKQIETVSTAASSRTSKERAEKGEAASESMELSEAETRYLIDEQLRKFGWEADTNNVRYSKGTRPQKGRNLAIAEWPTDSAVGKNGYADYALFVGLKLVGIVEAKKAALDIPAVIDHQCKEYAKGIKTEHKEYIINQWGAYKVPFVFATNGRKYLKQIDTKSGIWCLDLRSGANVPKALQGWISPQGLIEQLEKDVAAANAALQNTPFDLLRDPDGLNLRKYQISAIEAAEQAVIDGKQTVLLSMATGTGKTRTILGMIYRFIKSDRFKRVLFLVDRTALGEQAEDVFKEVKIEELMTLDSIYNIKGLDEKEIDKETKI